MIILLVSHIQALFDSIDRNFTDSQRFLVYCQPIMYIAGLAAVEVRCFWMSDDFGPFWCGYVEQKKWWTVHFGVA